MRILALGELRSFGINTFALELVAESVALRPIHKISVVMPDRGRRQPKTLRITIEAVDKAESSDVELVFEDEL